MDACYGGRFEKSLLYEVIGSVQVLVDFAFKVFCDADNVSEDMYEFVTPSHADVCAIELANRGHMLRVLLGEEFFKEAELDGLGLHDNAVLIKHEDGQGIRHAVEVSAHGTVGQGKARGASDRGLLSDVRA